MSHADLAPAIAAYIAATNACDTSAVAHCFADGKTLKRDTADQSSTEAQPKS